MKRIILILLFAGLSFSGYDQEPFFLEYTDSFDNTRVVLTEHFSYSITHQNFTVRGKGFFDIPRYKRDSLLIEAQIVAGRYFNNL
jgi:hypothetical protein